MVILFSYKKKKDASENKENFLWVTRGHNSVDGCLLPFKDTRCLKRLKLNLVLASEPTLFLVQSFLHNPVSSGQWANTGHLLSEHIGNP